MNLRPRQFRLSFAFFPFPKLRTRPRSQIVVGVNQNKHLPSVRNFPQLLVAYMRIYICVFVRLSNGIPRPIVLERVFPQSACIFVRNICVLFIHHHVICFSHKFVDCLFVHGFTHSCLTESGKIVCPHNRYI